MEDVNVDALTHAGNLDNLAGLEGNARYRFVHGDITDRGLLENICSGIEVSVHMAAELHVDRSIHDAEAFIRTNVLGTQSLLDAERLHGVKRFVHVSTNDVYGSLGLQGKFTEQHPLSPNSPYTASKAASDLLVQAAYHPHNLPVVITRCTNHYGPFNSRKNSSVGD